MFPNITPSTPNRIDEIQMVANEVIGKVCDKYAPDRSGVFLYMCDLEKLMWFERRIGTPEPERAVKSVLFAREKALRVVENYRAYGHLTSMQSRDCSVGHYGGAIIIPGEGALSISGLPEELDTPLVIALAQECGFITNDYTRKLACLLEQEKLVDGMCDDVSSWAQLR